MLNLNTEFASTENLRRALLTMPVSVKTGYVKAKGHCPNKCSGTMFYHVDGNAMACDGVRYHGGKVVACGYIEFFGDDPPAVASGDA